MYTRGYNNSMSAKRVSNRQLRREGIQAIQAFEHMRLILIGLLAQNSGQLHITTGTIDQVGREIDHLNYEIVTDPNDPKTRLVRLVDDRKEEAEAVLIAERKGGMTIARIADEPAETLSLEA